MKIALKSFLYLALLLLCSFLIRETNQLELKGPEQNPLLTVFLAQVKISNTPKSFLNNIISLINEVIDTYEKGLTRKKKEIHEIELNCSTGNASLTEKVEFFNAVKANLKEEMSLVSGPKQMARIIDRLNAEIKELEIKREKYDHEYNKHKLEYSHLTNLTKKFNEEIECVSEGFQKLYMGTLPDNKDPLSKFEKSEVHWRLDPCFKTLEKAVLEIVAYFDIKDINITGTVKSSLIKMDLNNSEHLQQIAGLAEVNNTVTQVYSYYSNIDQYYYNASRVLFHFSNLIHNKKSLLLDFKNHHFEHDKTLAQNLGDLLYGARNSIKLAKLSLTSFMTYCVDKISSLTSSIVRDQEKLDNYKEMREYLNKNMVVINKAIEESGKQQNYDPQNDQTDDSQTPSSFLIIKQNDSKSKELIEEAKNDLEKITF